MEKAEMKGKKLREKDSTAFFFLQAANELQNYFFSLSGQDQLFSPWQARLSLVTRSWRGMAGFFPFPWHQKKTKSNVDDKNDDNDDTFLLRR